MTTDGGEWTIELGSSGALIEGIDGTFAIIDEGDDRYRVSGPAGAIQMIATASSAETVWVGTDGQVFEFHVESDTGSARPITRDAEALSPPMSATVVRVLAQVGAKVEAGDTLLMLEAMKMELPIRAPRAGVVRAVHCREGDLVQPGTVLVEL